MRRLLRWLFNLSAVVSALLFAAVVLLWARSTSRTDGISHRPTPRRQLAAFTYRSSLYLERVDFGEDQLGHLRWDRVSESAAEADTGVQTFTDFDHWGLKHGGGRREDWHFVGLPLAGLALLTAGLPAWRARAELRRRRVEPGHCPACGYDLRATPDGGGPLLARCPECGAVPERV